MKFGIGHVRVSSNKQYEHGDSIENQMQCIEVAAKLAGYVIIRWFEEHYSGRKNQRMVIEDMLTYLDENRGDVDAVFINQINRFTRAGGDNYLFLRKQLFELGVELIDAYGVIQETKNTLAHLGFSYDWSNRAPSRMAEVIMAEQAHAEATDILTRTVGQSIRLEQGGYHVRAANIGYKNAKVMSDDGKKRPILLPHEIEAKWMISLFKLRADGQYSDHQICDKINAMGFKTRRTVRRDQKTRQIIGYGGERPLTIKRMDTYVTNPIYCGVRVGKWTHYEPIRTPFPGLVSIDLFNRANRGKVFIQELKDGKLRLERNLKQPQRFLRKTEFTLRHVVMCPECGKPLWGSYSKNRAGKRFGYYHCERKHKRFSVPKDVFESSVGYLLKDLRLKPSYLNVLKLAALKVWREKNAMARVEVETTNEHVNDLRKRQDLIIQKLQIIDSPIVIRRLEEEIEAIEADIKKADQHKEQYEVKEDQIMAYFDVAKTILEHPDKIVEKGLPREKLEKLWRTIFVQNPTWEEIDSGTPQLSLAYRLNRDIGNDQSELVGQLGKFWNTFECDVRRVVYGL